MGHSEAVLLMDMDQVETILVLVLCIVMLIAGVVAGIRGARGGLPPYVLRLLHLNVKETQKIDERALFEPIPVPEPATVEDPMLDSLLRFFKQSLTSRFVLRVLVKYEETVMSEQDITVEVNKLLRKRQKPELPESAIHTVVKILMGAGLAIYKEGDYCPTPRGKKLHALVERETH
jgi:hypothetical protein